MPDGCPPACTRRAGPTSSSGSEAARVAHGCWRCCTKPCRIWRRPAATHCFCRQFRDAKPSPKDVDACWDVTDVEVDALHPMFLDFYAGRAATLALFGAEFFPTTVIEGESQLTMLEFFQRTRTHEPVGIVALDLETL
jgi:uncharacterized protein DUF6932